MTIRAKRSTSRRWLAAGGALLMAASLAACSSGEQGKEPTVPDSSSEQASPSASRTAPPATVEDVVEQLVSPGGEADPSSIDPACAARAFEGVELSEAGQKELLRVKPSDYGAAILALKDGGFADDAKQLGDEGLLKALDLCRFETAGVEPEKTGVSVQPPKVDTGGRASVSEGSTKGTIDLEDEKEITSELLVEGVKRVFGSYARDEAQKQVIDESSSCLATEISEAGFSDKTLRMLASGPEPGSASKGAQFSSTAVASMLADEKEREIWRSGQFTSALNDCLIDGERSLQEKKKAAAEAEKDR